MRGTGILLACAALVALTMPVHAAMSVTQTRQLALAEAMAFGTPKQSPAELMQILQGFDMSTFDISAWVAQLAYTTPEEDRLMHETHMGANARSWPMCKGHTCGEGKHLSPALLERNCTGGECSDVQCCAENECICTYGKGAIGKACPQHGAPLCIECNAKYNLEGDNCTQDNCTCTNGEPVEWEDCPFHGAELCANCSYGYAGPNCREIVCPPLELNSKDAAVQPALCGTTYSPLNATCEFTCGPGFSQYGAKVARCNPSNGTRINCPSDLKTCPDGSVMNRKMSTGCAFDSCPDNPDMVMPDRYEYVPGAPFENSSETPALDIFEPAPHLAWCQSKCEMNPHCEVMAFGVDPRAHPKPPMRGRNTCRLYAQVPSTKYDGYYLENEGTMSSYVRPATHYGYTAFQASCVVGHNLRVATKTASADCAWTCAEDPKCIAFQWGWVVNTSSYGTCVHMDQMEPTTLCFSNGTLFITMVKDTEMIEERRVSTDALPPYFGEWTATPPKCHPKACVERGVRYAKNMCMGTYGDICRPIAPVNFTCTGQFVCDETGFFRSFTNDFPITYNRSNYTWEEQNYVNATCRPYEHCGAEFNQCDPEAVCTPRVVNKMFPWDEMTTIYQCECKPGFYGNGTWCREWTVCKTGFKEVAAPTQWVDRYCLDIDECAIDNGGCQSTCLNSEGSYSCLCPKGYELGNNLKSCNPIGCDPKTDLLWATNDVTALTKMSAQLECERGYEVMGTLTCGTDGIMTGDAFCAPKTCTPLQIEGQLGSCTGVVGEHCKPQCEAGYLSDGGVMRCNVSGVFEGDTFCNPLWCDSVVPPCTFEGEPTEDGTDCGASICQGRNGDVCNGTLGNFSCSRGWKAVGEIVCTAPNTTYPNFGWANFTKRGRNPKFRAENGTSVECADINECEINNGGCSQECRNLPGNYECRCARGYMLAEDGLSCLPLKCADVLPHINSTRPCSGTTGDVCTPLAAPGFMCKGEEQCTTNGTFTSGNVDCKPIECRENSVAGAGMKCVGKLGDLCDLNVQVKGFNCTGMMKCMPSGDFEEIEPTQCEPVKCPALDKWEIEFAGEGCPEGFYNDVCVPEPMWGYQCVGHAKCKGDGQWEIPTCMWQTSCKKCDKNAHCEGLGCECNEGYWGDGHSCAPISPPCQASRGMREVVEPSVHRDRYCMPEKVCRIDNGGCGNYSHCYDNSTGALCECYVGYERNASSEEYQCVPMEMAKDFSYKGAVDCVGMKVGEVCELEGLPGWTCSGNVTASSDGISYFGQYSCDRNPCATALMPNSQTICFGVLGDRCVLSCNDLYVPEISDGLTVCGDDGKWNRAQCIPISSKSCEDVFGSKPYKNGCGRVVSTEPEPECTTAGAIPIDELKRPIGGSGEHQICQMSCGDHTAECMGASTDSNIEEGSGVKFAEMEKACLDQGARLCTLPEVKGGAIFSGLDDACDINAVWTSDACNEERTAFWVEVANPDARSLSSQECRSIETDRALGRCCADAKPYSGWGRAFVSKPSKVHALQLLEARRDADREDDEEAAAANATNGTVEEQDVLPEDVEQIAQAVVDEEDDEAVAVKAEKADKIRAYINRLDRRKRSLEAQLNKPPSRIRRGGLREPLAYTVTDAIRNELGHLVPELVRQHELLESLEGNSGEQALGNGSTGEQPAAGEEQAPSDSDAGQQQ